jgi:ABC-type bacteriocin/lantibiotic exporter with double-glycine peptidase domain
VFRGPKTWFLAAAMIAVGQPARGQESICGARCAHHVLTLLNKGGDLTDVIQELYDSPGGGTVSFADLARVLRQRGVSCTSLSLGLLDAPNSPYPVILHVDGNHFVVLEKCNSGTAVVWDGLKGSEEVSWWQLRARCSSVVLVCTPMGEEKAKHTDSTFRYVAMTLGIGLMLLAVWTGCRLRGRRCAAPTSALVPCAQTQADGPINGPA